jgi:hypothetical protein
MTSQQPLSLEYPDQMPSPDPNRTEPAFWVRELGVFKRLEEGPENEVRRISLRRGLNILWAKPEDEHGPVRLYEPGLSGHASGKTTFCRMVRHILGEKHFANDLVTRGVRERFEGGWILGEVFIKDDLWLVGRPFTLGAHPFCARGCTIDEYLKVKPSHELFQVFLSELDDATVKALTVKMLPKSGEIVTWPHLLQWLTRDQECRFIQLTDWRSKLSKSEAPDMPIEDQHSLMRSVVGVLSEEERKEIENNAKLNRQKEVATDEVPILQSQARTDHQRLESALGRQLPTPDDPLLVENVRTELREALAKAESDIKQVDTDVEFLKLEEAYETAIKKTTEVDTELRLLDIRQSELETKLQLHQRKKSDKGARDFAASIAPGVGYCRVPIEEAKAKGCTLAFDQPRDLESERVLQSIEDFGADIEKDIETLTRRKKSLSELLTKYRQEEQVASKELFQRRTNLARKRNELYNQRSELLDRIKLAQRAHDAWLKSDELARRIQDLEKDIQTSRGKQEKYRERTTKAVNDLSLIYQEIVRAVLGNLVSGAIQLSGRDFVCKINHNGDLSSGAIDTIKILAFDLAALAASVAGQGDHPRFLLHDSPREADMAPLTYKRLFLWAQKLEEEFNGQPCNFQYIITTTEAPPEDLQTDPWLLDPVLDASLPEKRLLGVDL